MSSIAPPVRPEYELDLPPLPPSELVKDVRIGARIWEQAWVRKACILIVLAVIWESAARWQDNDLLLPTFSATMLALFNGLASGELVQKTWLSLQVLLQGYLAGILLSFALTTLAVS